MRSFRVSARIAALVSAGLVATSLAAAPTVGAFAADPVTGGTISGTITVPAGVKAETVWVWGYVSLNNRWVRQPVTVDGKIVYPRTRVQPGGTYALAVPSNTDYRLEFTDGNGELINEFYSSPDSDAPIADKGSSITVRDGKTVTVAPIAMTKGVTIRGFVNGDGSSKPDDINGTRDVAAELFDASGTKPADNPVLTDYTDHDGVGVIDSTDPNEVVDDTDKGEYKIGGVRPGVYKLRFNAFETRSYSNQFYNGAFEWAKAAVIEVKATDTVIKLDAVKLVPQGIIAGRILKPVLGTEGAEQTFVQAFRRTVSGEWDYAVQWMTNSAPVDSASELKGQYTIAGLAPGLYQVCAYPAGTTTYCWDNKTGDKGDLIEVVPYSAPLKGVDIVLGTKPVAPPNTAPKPVPVPVPAPASPSASPTASATAAPTPTLPPAPVAPVVDSVQLQKAPKAAGKLRVGSKIWVTKFSFLPTNAKVTYRWYAGGKRIKKANKWAFKLTRAQRNKTIKVRVVVSYPGMKPAVRTLKFKGKVS